MDWTLSQIINETERYAKHAAKVEASGQKVASGPLKNESILAAKRAKVVLTDDQMAFVRDSFNITKEAVLSGKGFEAVAKSWTQTRIKLN